MSRLMRRVALVALVLLAGLLALRWMPRPAAVGVGAPCADTDVLTPMPSPALRDRGRQLLLRQSGLAQKEFFLELHRADTVFDDCRRPSSPALDEVHVDRAQGRPSAVAVDGDRISVLRESGGSVGPLDRLPVLVTGP